MTEQVLQPSISGVCVLVVNLRLNTDTTQMWQCSYEDAFGPVTKWTFFWTQHSRSRKSTIDHSPGNSSLKTICRDSIRLYGKADVSFTVLCCIVIGSVTSPCWQCATKLSCTCARIFYLPLTSTHIEHNAADNYDDCVLIVIWLSSC